ARATTSALPGADPSADGTVVRRHPPRMPGSVVGVASERDVLLLESTASTADVLDCLDSHHVAGKQLHAVSDNLTLVISRENLHDEQRLRAALEQRFSARVRLHDNVGALSIVGAGINASFENVRRGSGALTADGTLPRDVSTSSFRVTWMVDRSCLDDAVRRL